MLKYVEVDPAQSGLQSLLGQKVMLMCVNYFYVGTLTGVNDTCVELGDAAIVFETGPFRDKASGKVVPDYKDIQKLHVPTWFVSRAAIESFGLSK